MPRTLAPELYASPAVELPYSFDGISFKVSLHEQELNVLPYLIARCPPPKLLSLLTYTPPANPNLTKAGTKRIIKHKRHVDESAEFYTAQLLHYGLKPLKTKAPAKAALLKAFDAQGGKLKVPKELKELEQRLTNTFHVADQAARQVAEKRAKKEGKRDGVRTMAEEEEEMAERDLKRSRESSFGSSVSWTYVAEEGPKKKAPRKAGKKTKSSKKTNATPSLYPRVFTQGVFLNFCSSYLITSPSLASRYPFISENPLKMELFPSFTSYHLWASFDLGVLEGIFRSSPDSPLSSIPSTSTSSSFSDPSSPNTVSFQWRGRDSGSGEVTTDELNKGTLTFVGPGFGKIKGRMYWDCVPGDGYFEFEGIAVEEGDERLDQGEQVMEWKMQYRELKKGGKRDASDTEDDDWDENAESDDEEDGYGCAL